MALHLVHLLKCVLGDVTPAGEGPEPDDDHNRGADVQQSAVPDSYWCSGSHSFRTSSINAFLSALFRHESRCRSPTAAASLAFVILLSSFVLSDFLFFLLLKIRCV